jgi:hypothetical protein
MADLQRRGAMPTPYGPVTDAAGSLTLGWGLVLRRMLQIAGFLELVVCGASDARGRYTPTTVATVPTLNGLQDACFPVYLADYNHLLQWSGSAWKFSLGDGGNGYYATFAVAPTTVGWHLCDGSTVSYVVLGATVTTTTIVLPTVANQYFRQ